MRDLRHLFQDVQPEDLHYLYGGNCFQHAIGYNQPIMGCEKLGDITKLNYVTLCPGSNAAVFYGAQTLPEFNILLKKACEEEGLKNIGDNFRECEGFRTLAVFSGRAPNGRLDYHFAFMNDDGLWEHKVPFKPVTTNKSTEEIEANTIYEFQFYALVPEGKKPLLLEDLETAQIDMGTGEDPRPATIVVISDKTPALPINPYTVISDLGIMADANKNMFRAPTIPKSVMDHAFDLDLGQPDFM